MNWRVSLWPRAAASDRSRHPVARCAPRPRSEPTMPPRLPSLFLSHGAPDIVLSKHALLDALRSLAARLPKPRGIVIVSAHWTDDPIGVTSGAELPTVHDFNGFPDALYQLRYPAPGDDTLSAEVGQLLRMQGFENRLHPQRGLDHGAWVPLTIMYPAADVPVVQVSLPSGSLQNLVRLGAALAPLRRQGVLIIGSGGSVHNMLELNLAGRTDDWALDFEDWLDEAVAGGHFERLITPGAFPATLRRAHPSLDHYAPLVVAWAAGDRDLPGRRIHQSFSYGNLGMSCFEFGREASAEPGPSMLPG